MTIAVVGDALLDIDLDGTSERRAPDTGAPVVDVQDRRSRAGGAGLAARLLLGDGVPVRLVTALADDPSGEELRERLAGVELVAARSRVPTPVKARLASNGKPLARVDLGCGETAAPIVSDHVLAAIAEAEAILVSDYGRGFAADPRVRAALAQRAAEAPVVWDPHPTGPPPVTGARVVTPNLAELRRVAEDAGVRAPSLGAVAGRLRELWGAGSVVVTLGEHGAYASADPVSWVERPPLVATGDPCGAGDRFAASLVRDLAVGRPLHTAVRSGVREAALFIRMGGVAALPEPGSPVLDPSAVPALA